MKIKFSSLLLILFSMFLGNTYAQLKQFTLEDLNFGGNNYYNMTPKNKYTSWWGETLVHDDYDKCSVVNPKNAKEKLLFTLDDINAVIEKSGLGEDGKIRSLYSAEFPYADKTVVMLSNGRMRILVDWKNKNVVAKFVSGQGMQAEEWSAASQTLAYVKNDNLYVVGKDGKAAQLTTDGSRDIVYGQSVHRNEFGINKGLFWSNDGQSLAFYRMDQSMVTDYPLVGIDTRIATLEPEKYPMAGETSHEVTVGVYSLKTGKTVYLNVGNPKDRYFTNIAWTPDNKQIYLIEVNRDQTDASLDVYDAQTGNKVKTLYREHHDKYVHPVNPVTFLPWDSSKFILQSERDGYNHLYLFSTEGGEPKQITSGKWVVLALMGFDVKNKSAIILSTECSPIQNNIYSVNIASGKRKLLDNGKGCHANSGDGHKLALSPKGSFIIDNYTEPDVPRNIDIIDTKTTKRVNYFTSDDPWKGYAVPQFTSGTIKAADGTTDLYYRMVKPADFDPSKKYPTVVYVYGGPGVRNVEARWHYWSRGWETYMAQKGYIVFILDNRGSSDRGRDFEQATFRHLGVEEMKDQICGVDYLKTLPYVDADRLGVHGWSFGGFMTTSLMTTYPDVFKVGVAGGPVIDWKYYEVMYGERYMDTPQANPEGYKESSLLYKAKNLKGKLQIITGMNDPVVVPQNCLAFLQACIAAGTQPDFFVYPGEPHNMRGHQSVHLHERITQYFEDYLK